MLMLLGAPGVLLQIVSPGWAAEWKPAAGPLSTRWTKDVLPSTSHSEYPRPQMVRDAWQSLNGLWEYAIRPRGENRPDHFEGSILVPFPIESSLSGVMKRIGPDRELWYRRTVSVEPYAPDKRLLLHFDAVDWESTVWLDGAEIGVHRGGYTPFVFDVTDRMTQGKPHELVVKVWDPSDAGTQPCGKQHNKPEGIWYTPSTGIWQTVWLEPVPRAYFRDIRIEPDLASGKVRIVTEIANAPRHAQVRATVAAETETGSPSPQIAVHQAAVGEPLTISVPRDEIKPWSPDSPVLDRVQISLVGGDGKVGDRVSSYFAFRSIAISEGQNGQPARILLNGKPTFLIGPLDQGFWPDGLYTAPTDEALRSDLEVTKRLGFNLVRKHVKVEPPRWYYWCDKLGLAVWQDMPSGDRSAKWPSPHGEIRRTPESAAEFDNELKAMIDARRNSPCIVAWVPFNEGWGQFDTVRIAKWVKAYDPSRLVIPASGGNHFPVGDIHDIHAYPGPAAPPADPVRAEVLGEFGGLGLPVAGHLWADKKNWGYRKYKTRDELTDAYLDLVKKLKPLGESRLSAAVYTQTTDVETEVNGLMTYDRALIKMDADKVRRANRRLCGHNE
jgi:beta-galactosidase/beta-glucuronidase